MSPKVIWIVAGLFFLTPLCHAETIYLKNGDKIEGEIVEETIRLIRVNISGVTLTYYLDDIKSIEGRPEPVGKTNMPYEPKPPSDDSQAVGPALAEKNKKELILLYLNVSGMKKTLDAMFTRAIEDASGQDAVRLKQAYNLDEILEVLVPVYSKYFTVEDLRTLISFHQSPVAKKVSKAAPQIMEDALKASAQYFRVKMPEEDSPFLP